LNYVYILRCADDTLYCGWTTDLEARLATHNSGRGAKYTRSRRPVELVYSEAYDDRHDALSREWHIKRMSREEKLKLARAECATELTKEKECPT
jgi:putative endonuclease